MTLEFRWTISRGRDSYGYNICSLWVDGQKVSSCNGGGYDMEGTALGTWVAARYAGRLIRLRKNKLGKDGFYGLTFHDPDFDPGKAMIKGTCALGGGKGKTVEQAEKDGDSMGLERYQAFHSASAPRPSKRHRAPLIDGACGISSVMAIAQAIGLTFEYVNTRGKNSSVYILHDKRKGNPQ